MSSSARVATDRFFLYNEGFQIFIPNGWVELMAFCLSFKLSDSTVDVDLIDPASSLLSSGSTNSSVTLGWGHCRDLLVTSFVLLRPSNLWLV